VEICSSCHPFLHGPPEARDTAGRIEKFNRKYGKSKAETEAEAEAPPARRPRRPEARVFPVARMRHLLCARRRCWSCRRTSCLAARPFSRGY